MRALPRSGGSRASSPTVTTPSALAFRYLWLGTNHIGTAPFPSRRDSIGAWSIPGPFSKIAYPCNVIGPQSNTRGTLKNVIRLNSGGMHPGGR